MNKINYHDFYTYLWEDENRVHIISDRFIEEEEDRWWWWCCGGDNDGDDRGDGVVLVTACGGWL